MHSAKALNENPQPEFLVVQTFFLIFFICSTVIVHGRHCCVSPVQQTNTAALKIQQQLFWHLLFIAVISLYIFSYFL